MYYNSNNKVHTSIQKIALYPLTSYMFRPIIWPFSGRQNTNDEYTYVYG